MIWNQNNVLNSRSFLLLEQFRMKKQTGQYTKLCIKCLDIAKKSKEKHKCLHGKHKSICKICEGSAICEHQRIRSSCKECGGGGRCEHNRVRSSCKECEGGQICQHQKRRSICKICDPTGHLANVVRSRISIALKHNKEMHSIEYIGCTIEELRQHIELQFKDGMSWK